MQIIAVWNTAARLRLNNYVIIITIPPR